MKVNTISQHQQQAVIAGTVSYMAPERLINLGADNRKCDVWSCGVILYTMLTGEVLFDLKDEGKA